MRPDVTMVDTDTERRENWICGTHQADGNLADLTLDFDHVVQYEMSQYKQSLPAYLLVVVFKAGVQVLGPRLDQVGEAEREVAESDL